MQMTQTAMWAIGILITLITVTFIILGFAFGRLKETTDRADKAREEAEKRVKIDTETATGLSQLLKLVEGLTETVNTKFKNFDEWIREHDRCDREFVQKFTRVESETRHMGEKLEEHGSRIKVLEERRKEVE